MWGLLVVIKGIIRQWWGVRVLANMVRPLPVILLQLLIPPLRSLFSTVLLVQCKIRVIVLKLYETWQH